MGIDGTRGGRGVAAVVALVAAGTLAGCSGEVRGAAGPGTTGTTTTTTGTTAAGATTGTTASAKPPRCTNLEVSAPEVAQDSGSLHVRVVFTNRGGRECSVAGFPGVRLDGADGTSWDLVRQHQAPASLTLPPDGRAMSKLTFLPEAPETGWAVRTLVVTPPDTTQTQELPWTAGPVLKQDAATHPGTYIGPLSAM